MVSAKRIRVLLFGVRMSFLGKWLGFDLSEIFDEGVAAYDRGDHEAAIEAFERCISESTDPSITRLSSFHLAQSHAALGAIRLAGANYAEALSLFESALEQCPSYPDLSLGAARACYGLGEQKRCCKYVEQALAINPRYVDAILMQAICLYSAGSHAAALSRVLDACEIDPALSAKSFPRILQHHECGYSDLVISELLAMLRSNKDAALLARVGDSYIRERLFDRAAEQYQRALELEPNYADLHLKLAIALESLGQVNEAIASIERALQINPNYQAAQRHLATTKRKAKSSA